MIQIISISQGIQNIDAKYLLLAFLICLHEKATEYVTIHSSFCGSSTHLLAVLDLTEALLSRPLTGLGLLCTSPKFPCLTQYDKQD